jgi:acyl-CoA synthetase (NDP forming)
MLSLSIRYSRRFRPCHNSNSSNDNYNKIRKNYDKILFNVRKYIPDANIRGIIVQELIEDKKETIIGVMQE